MGRQKTSGICANSTFRTGMSQFSSSLLEKFPGPRFHLNIERGLLLHSVGVTCNALDVRTLLAPDIPDESIVIAALFHDLGKVGYPGKPQLCPTATAGKSRSKVSLIGNRIDLTEDEAQAIVSHDGIYPVPGGVNNLDYHHRECRLQMIVHFADKWTAAVDEERREPNLYFLHQQSHLLRPRQLALQFIRQRRDHAVAGNADGFAGIA